MANRYAAYSKLKIDYPAQRVLRITFDRPETYNSVDAETHTQITNIWRDINEDHDINAIIVTGAGKAFSAGGDFELIEEHHERFRALRDVDAGRKRKTSSTTSSTATSRSSRPSTASAVGAGLVVGILADISICGEIGADRRRAHAAGSRGRRPSPAIIWPLLCGLAKAKYYLMTVRAVVGRGGRAHRTLCRSASRMRT